MARTAREKKIEGELDREAPAGESPGERRRKDLLEAAYTLVAEKGLEGLRTRDIAARARVNISTLHYYFETKEALLIALVQHVPEKFAAAGEADPIREAAPRKGARPRRAPWTLRSQLEETWERFQADPHLNTVLHELAMRAHRDLAARKALRAVLEGWNADVEGMIRRGIREGQIRADVDPRAGARIVTSFVMGAMLQLGVDADAFDFTEVARQLETWLSVRSTAQR